MPKNAQKAATMPAGQLWAVVLAAGSGARLAETLGQTPDGQPRRKQYLEHQGVPLFWHSARTFARAGLVQGLVFVFPPEDLPRMQAEVQRRMAEEPLGLPWRVAGGGARRQDSVRLGLNALPAEGPDACARVLVHDSARPFASPALARRVAEALDAHEAAIPAIAVTDTIKRVTAQADGGELVAETFERASLRAVQTPQGFRLPGLVAAHERAQAEGWDVTDDAALMERAGSSVAVVPGEEANVKITTPEDLTRLGRQDAPKAGPRTGWGYDVHRFAGPKDSPKDVAKRRPMVLGAVAIPGAPEVIAHSDGDVLLHALVDALLGLACAGDIGELFPDTDAQFDNMPSSVFVAEALARVRACGLAPAHADLTIVAQTPKLSPHKRRIAKSVAQLLELPEDQVNVKATTEEGLGFTGEKKGIKAVAVVTALPG